MQKSNIIIIGGGLSGLLIAYLLEKEGVSYQILEARNRLGGRIHTLRSDKNSPIEMGATWLGKKHHHLLDLLDELMIDIDEQHMGDKAYYEPMSVSPPQLVDLPPNEEPSYRISGGTDTVVQTFTNLLDQPRIHYNQIVKTIRKTDTNLEIKTESDLFEANVAISTLPPKLMADRIDFFPSLPGELTEIASQTHTWMGESIKVALTFEEPFWRNGNSSGTIFSNVGPINEMYDHSTNNIYALMGFMNNAYHSVGRTQREQLILEQLERFYGEKVYDYKSYHESIWQQEPFTFSPYRQPVIPHQNNGHSIFKQLFLENRLLIAGSETATEFPGYMDGAVESAKRAVQKTKKLLSG